MAEQQNSMKPDLRAYLTRILVASVMLVFGKMFAADLVPSRPSDLSLKKEVARAIDRGSHWLVKNQQEDGTWSDGDHPAVTALALVALQGDPEEHHRAVKAPALAKGYQYILDSVKPSGGIHRIESLMNYNTAVSILALVVANNPEYYDTIRNARKFVIGGQQDYGEPGQIDNVLDGGIGYGNSYSHSDMSNTLFALESLYYSRHVVVDSGVDPEENLDWKAAIQFIQNCQNLPETNKQAWASGDEANKGGFVYFPGNSKAGEMELSEERTALRSYGSISYAGLLSFIYAEMEEDDVRVEAVLDWLEKNYTLEENPGMGEQGLYYYFYTMSKALSLAGIESFKTRDGGEVLWARSLALKMLDSQQGDGRWVNDNSRWWEKDSALVTSYAVLTLINLYSRL